MLCLRCFKAKLGMTVTYSHHHRKGDGTLISAENTRRFNFLRRWDAWRVSYCEKHRNDAIPIDFRLGKVNPITLFVSLLIIGGVKWRQRRNQQQKDMAKQ